MYFRFGAGIVLAVLISIAGIALEKRSLELRRQVARQHYQMDVLWEEHAKLRLQTQQLGATVRLFDSLEDGKLNVEQPKQPVDAEPRRMPLLRWQRGPGNGR